MMTTTTESDQTSLAALMAQQGDEVMPDGTLQTGTTMSRGGGVTTSRLDEQVAEGEARVEDLAFKGYVTVWDNRTGRAVLQPYLHKHRPEDTPELRPKLGVSPSSRIRRLRTVEGYGLQPLLQTPYPHEDSS